MSEHEHLEMMLGTRHDLSAAERRALGAHLAACAACRARAEEYARQDLFLRALPLPSPAPALRQGVVARIDRAPSWRQRTLQKMALFGAPAVVIALAVVLLATRVHPPASNSNAVLAPVFGPARTPPSSDEGIPPTVDSAAPTQRSGASAPGAIPASPLIPPAPQSNTTSHGILLTLIAPRTDYPKRALVPVEMVVQNRTDDPVWVHADTVGECEQSQPVAEAIDAHGRAVDPLPGQPIPSCPLLLPGPDIPGYLRPGQSLKTSTYVILLTDRIRARVGITFLPGCSPTRRTVCRGQDIQVLGVPLRFSVRSGRAPRVVLRGLPPTTFRLIPARRRVPLWYTGWYECSSGPGQAWSASQGWISVPAHAGNGPPALRLDGCSPNNFVLHLIAGYPGQPVAFITETRGHPHL